MRQNQRYSGNGANKIISQLTADKKKSAFAIGLILIMLFMWVKVLKKDGPKSAKASVRLEQDQSTKQVEISYKELPIVSGRNDVLARDFFTMDDRVLRSGEHVNVLKTDKNTDVIKKLAEQLKLEAIGIEKEPQAFISGKLLSVGDKFLISDGLRNYECEVVEIEVGKVSIRCGETEIELKLETALR